jgi:endonuclease-3
MVGLPLSRWQRFSSSRGQRKVPRDEAASDMREGSISFANGRLPYNRPMNPQKRREIFERLRAANPNPRSELEYKTPFELLVAVVLSAQATDKGVNKATARLFPVARTPADFVKLGVDGLIPYISSIGLFNMKAKNVIALSRKLLDEYGGEVPRDREALEKLPGVGRKTANVVLNVAFGEPTIAVDTHIFRVANRTRLAVGKDPEAVERQLVKFTPQEFRLNAHHWLILHGRYVCKARVPRCPQCIIADLCEYKAKTRALPGMNDVATLPLKPRAGAPRRNATRRAKA